MSDEIIENKNTENTVVEEKKEDVSTDHITLESLANDMATIKNDFNKKLQEKESEINNLKENKNKLEKALNEQNALIGNFRESIFNNAKITPEASIKPNEAYLKQCYEDAFRAAYQRSKHRLIGKNNDENLFIDKCLNKFMEANNGKL